MLHPGRDHSNQPSFCLVSFILCQQQWWCPDRFLFHFDSKTSQCFLFHLDYYSWGKTGYNPDTFLPYKTKDPQSTVIGVNISLISVPSKSLFLIPKVWKKANVWTKSTEYFFFFFFICCTLIKGSHLWVSLGLYLKHQNLSLCFKIYKASK